MTTAVNRVFPTKRASEQPRKCILLGPRPRLLGGRIGKGSRVEASPYQSIAAAVKAVAQKMPRLTWISPKAEFTQELLRALAPCRAVLAKGAKPGVTTFGDLVMRGTPNLESLPLILIVKSFDHVVAEVGPYRLLPPRELNEVLTAPKNEARDLFIGGLFDPVAQTLLLTRGDFDIFIVPVSFFRPSGTIVPDPRALAVTDYGHTIKLGKYEAATDVILYELDPDYRRRMKAKRRQEEKGFGPSLRRLRIQRRVKRTEFPGISPKTIARIERGETAKPHGKTLAVIASTLGVEPEEIETH